MIKSPSVSSECSLPPLEDDVSSVCSDELLGSQSRRWLTDIMTGDAHLEAEAASLGSDGLFVDRHFPVGQLEMQPGVRWKRPKVTGKHTNHFTRCESRFYFFLLMHKCGNRSSLNVDWSFCLQVKVFIRVVTYR